MLSSLSLGGGGFFFWGDRRALSPALAHLFPCSQKWKLKFPFPPPPPHPTHPFSCKEKNGLSPSPPPFPPPAYTGLIPSLVFPHAACQSHPPPFWARTCSDTFPSMPMVWLISFLLPTQISAPPFFFSRADSTIFFRQIARFFPPPRPASPPPPKNGYTPPSDDSTPPWSKPFIPLCIKDYFFPLPSRFLPQKAHAESSYAQKYTSAPSIFSISSDCKLRGSVMVRGHWSLFFPFPCSWSLGIVIVVLVPPFSFSFP